MNLTIKRPNFDFFSKNACLSSNPLFTNGDLWFDREVEPLNKLLKKGFWLYHSASTECSQLQSHKHKFTRQAFLILDQPIKPKTKQQKLEECLQEILEWDDAENLDMDQWTALRDKAKSLLEEN